MNIKEAMKRNREQLSTVLLENEDSVEIASLSVNLTLAKDPEGRKELRMIVELEDSDHMSGRITTKRIVDLIANELAAKPNRISHLEKRVDAEIRSSNLIKNTELFNALSSMEKTISIIESEINNNYKFDWFTISNELENKGADHVIIDKLHPQIIKIKNEILMTHTSADGRCDIDSSNDLVDIMTKRSSQANMIRENQSLKAPIMAINKAIPKKGKELTMH